MRVSLLKSQSFSISPNEWRARRPPPIGAREHAPLTRYPGGTEASNINRGSRSEAPPRGTTDTEAAAPTTGASAASRPPCRSAPCTIMRATAAAMMGISAFASPTSYPAHAMGGMALRGGGGECGDVASDVLASEPLKLMDGVDPPSPTSGGGMPGVAAGEAIIVASPTASRPSSRMAKSKMKSVADVCRIPSQASPAGVTCETGTHWSFRCRADLR
jgi:hypothetical protein